MLDVPIFLAFTAGLVSFLAPCVLPLIPGYLAYLSGISLDQSASQRWKVFLNSLFFVLGFSLVFASLGVLLNTILEAVAYDVLLWLSRIGGAVIIFFGLYLIGLIKLDFLNKEYRLRVSIPLPRYFSSFVFGAAFAAGWTPCVGAVLGAILGLAASSPGSAFTLLLAYSLGFGLPFLVVGLFAQKASVWISKLGPSLLWINIIFGVVLVIFGILIFTQNLVKIANFEFLLQLQPL